MSNAPASYSYRDLHTWAAGVLEEAGIGPAVREAGWLLAHVTGHEAGTLHAAGHLKLTSAEKKSTSPACGSGRNVIPCNILSAPYLFVMRRSG